MAIPGVIKRFSTELNFKSNRTVSSTDTRAHTFSNSKKVEKSWSSKLKLLNRQTFPLGPDSKAGAVGASQSLCKRQMNNIEYDAASQQSDEAARRVQKLRGFLGVTSPHGRLDHVGPECDASSSSLREGDTKKNGDTTPCAHRISESLASTSSSSSPEFENEASETMVKNQRNESTSTLTSTSPPPESIPKLPPLQADVLWLSLTFIPRPLPRTACHTCYRAFASWKAPEHAAWRLHNCGHYIHLACLAQLRSSDIVKREGLGEMRCRSCECLSRRLGKIGDGEFERRVRRLEEKLLPWRVDGEVEYRPSAVRRERVEERGEESRG